MINFFFGWLLKPDYLLTPLDQMVMLLEIIGACYLACFIASKILK